MKSDDLAAHVSVVILWQYRAGEKSLTPEQYRHIADCNDCMAVLGTCQSCTTLDDVRRRLTEKHA